MSLDDFDFLVFDDDDVAGDIDNSDDSLSNSESKPNPSFLFRRAIFDNDIDRVGFLWHKHRSEIDLEERTAHGFTPILIAASRCSLRMFKKLESYGANIDALQSQSRLTCLTLATVHYYCDNFKKRSLYIEMFDAGVDINRSCCCNSTKIQTIWPQWKDKTSEELVRLFLACGSRPHQLKNGNAWAYCVPPGLLFEFNDAEDSPVRTLVYAAVEECRQQLSSSDVQRALTAISRTRLNFIRNRAFTICIGLQALELPAFVTLQIIDQSWKRLADLVPMHQKWSIITIVKHFKDKNDVDE